MCMHISVANLGSKCAEGIEGLSKEAQSTDVEVVSCTQIEFHSVPVRMFLLL